MADVFHVTNGPAGPPSPNIVGDYAFFGYDGDGRKVFSATIDTVTWYAYRAAGNVWAISLVNGQYAAPYFSCNSSGACGDTLPPTGYYDAVPGEGYGEDYEGSGYGDCECACHTLPNPECIKVKAADAGGTPTYDYEGDYDFTGEYFPPDDDTHDYGVFSDGTHYIWRCDDRWCMGDAVDGTADYQSLVTDKRTPPRGPWLPVGSGVEGRYKTLPTCTGRLWFPWCSCPCTCSAPEPYLGCVSVACVEGECPEEFLGAYYPQGEVGGTWSFSNGIGGYLGFNVSTPPRCAWEIGDTFSPTSGFRKRPEKGAEWPGDPTGTYYGNGDYDGMTLEVTSTSCGVYNYCGIQNVPIAWSLPMSGFGEFTQCPCDSTDVYSFNGNRTWLIPRGGTCWGAGQTLQVCWYEGSELNDRVFSVGISFKFVQFEYDPGPPPVYHYTPTLVVSLRWYNGLGTSFCGKWWQYEGQDLVNDYEALDPIELTLVSAGETSCLGFAPFACEEPLVFTPPETLTITPVL